MVVVVFYENNILVIFRRDKKDCIRKENFYVRNSHS